MPPQYPQWIQDRIHSPPGYAQLRANTSIETLIEIARVQMRFVIDVFIASLRVYSIGTDATRAIARQGVADAVVYLGRTLVLIDLAKHADTRPWGLPPNVDPPGCSRYFDVEGTYEGKAYAYISEFQARMTLPRYNPIIAWLGRPMRTRRLPSLPSQISAFIEGGLTCNIHKVAIRGFTIPHIMRLYQMPGWSDLRLSSSYVPAHKIRFLTA